MVKREYFEASREDWDRDFDKRLKRLGDEGWELVTVRPEMYNPARMEGAEPSPIYVFKRPMP
jgi:hypothetical protein